MASKLYPPIISDKLPPLVLENKYLKITINFEANFVADSEISNGMVVRISEAMSNSIIGSFEVNSTEEETGTSYIDVKNKIVNIYYNKEDLKFISSLRKNQFYKIQLAYKNGYFSNYGVSKFLDATDFSVTITNLLENNFREDTDKDLIEILRDAPSELIGAYSSKDLSEAAVAYEFNLYQGTTLIDSTGRQLHNNSISDFNYIELDDKNNRTRISKDSFPIVKEIENMNTCRAEYIVYTTNGHKLSAEYKFSIGNLNPPRCTAVVVGENCPDEGYNKVYCKINSLFGKKWASPMTLAGTYQVFRSDNKNDDKYSYWEHIADFKLPALELTELDQNNNNINGNINNELGQLVYVDYLIEQGVSYKYAISVIWSSQDDKKDKVVYKTNKIISDEVIYSDFETAFLYDADHQLAIKYNPKVSSFKTTKLEQKVDTLGSIYPYFSKNYNTNYKEFPISGLISVLMDDQLIFTNGVKLHTQKLFDEFNGVAMTETENKTAILEYREAIPSTQYPDNLDRGSSTDLTSWNFKTERDFKLAVLDWLNNGQLKVFKSAGEGNYIVRLMNVSLTPTDSLGRMLHTFQCTTYEAAPYNLKSLIDNGLFSIEQLIIGKQQGYEEKGVLQDGIYVFDLSKYKEIVKIEFFNFPWRTELISYVQDTSIWTRWNTFSDKEFSFTDDFTDKNGSTITKITADQVKNLEEGLEDRTYLVVHAKSFVDETFDSIEGMQQTPITIKQYISENYFDDSDDSNESNSNASTFFFDDDFNALTDIKQQSNYVNKLIIKKRPIEEKTDIPNLEDKTFYPVRYFLNPLRLYHLKNDMNYWSQDIYGIVHHYQIQSNNDDQNNNVPEYIAFYKRSDNSIVQLYNAEDEDIKEYKDLSDVSSITLGIGLYCEISYPAIQLIYKNEQAWRDDNKDNDILCGYINGKPELEDGEYVVNEDEQNCYIIGLNCYNFINLNDYSGDITTINQTNKMRENGKYMSDRAYIVEQIEQRNEQDEENKEFGI